MSKTHIKKRSNLPLNALRSFEVAARLGTQSAASSELFVTHGAISRQIANLEDYLGLKLFIGAKRAPELTEVGKRLLQNLTPAFDQIDEAVRQAKNADERVLDVHCYSTFAILWLIPRLHKFQGIRPNLRIKLTTDASVSLLARSPYDLAILLIDDEADLQPSDTPLMDEKLGFVIAPGLLGDATPQTLGRFARIETSTRLDAWPAWVNLMDAPIDLDQMGLVSTYEHYSFAIEATANGMGSCIAPYHLVYDKILDGKLVAPFGFVESGRTYIIRSLRDPNPKCKAFCEWLRKEIQSEA